MAFATWRLRRRLRPRLNPDEEWQAAARDYNGSWWVVTTEALIIAARSGRPERRVPLSDVIEVRSTEQGSLYVRTRNDGVLIGSFASDSEIGRLLAAGH